MLTEVAVKKRIVRVGLRQSGVEEAVSTPRITRVNYPSLRIISNVRRGFSGASAYEIALKYGYEGTEEEWLESIRAESATAEWTTLDW